MFTKDESLNLLNLGDGAIPELFETELKKVLKNISNPNADTKMVRKIVIEVAIKPDEKKDLGLIGVKVSSKLAGPKIFTTKVFFGRDKTGNMEAKELGSSQGNLFTKNNVVSIDDKKEGNDA